MRLKKHVLKAPIFILIFLIFYSCSSTKNQKTKSFSQNDALIYGEAATKEDTYANIKGSVARLRAMLCGKFIHYTVNQDPEKIKYTPWLVNENQDSVIHFYLPVGNHHKDGYWVYHYQCLTSLVDDPISERFFKLVELNRDSIQASFYVVPEDFNVGITQLLKDIKNNFADINWEKLDTSDRMIYYVRQTPLSYEGESNLTEIKKTKYKGGYKAFYYTVGVDKMEIGMRGYNKDKLRMGESKPERLIKEAMVKLDLLLY